MGNTDCMNLVSNANNGSLMNDNSHYRVKANSGIGKSIFGNIILNQNKKEKENFKLIEETEFMIPTNDEQKNESISNNQNIENNLFNKEKYPFTVREFSEKDTIKNHVISDKIKKKNNELNHESSYKTISSILSKISPISNQ